MRSVVVVFPASMWAMMPMFRIRSSGVTLGISSYLVGARQWRAPTPLVSKNAGRPGRPRTGRSRSAVIRVGAQHAAPLQPRMQDPLDQGPEVVRLSVYHR